ncbi:MAG: signal recognition particle-docking protein FtsY [bacterium]|nr:signal recognition particle-docking protein FtsY [bacterium]
MNYFYILAGCLAVVVVFLFILNRSRKKSQIYTSGDVKLQRITDSFKNKIISVFSKGNWREILIEELRSIFLESDAGPAFTERLLETIQKEIHDKKLEEKDQVIALIRSRLLEIMKGAERKSDFIGQGKKIILVLGVNGVGKTTTIGKLAYYLKENGKRVLLSAADTYRAAADEQLKVWGERAGVKVISQTPGADPGAVVYDSIESFKIKDYDHLIIDTAGRLHNKDNLIRQLEKVYRVINKTWARDPDETILVIDANTGQNALQQAEIFYKNFRVTGIILSKLDGTAKGGAVLSIMESLKIPVVFVGLGEKIDSLKEFHPDEFINSFI